MRFNFRVLGFGVLGSDLDASTAWDLACRGWFRDSPGPPQGLLIESLSPLIVGIRGISEGSFWSRQGAGFGA